MTDLQRLAQILHDYAPGAANALSVAQLAKLTGWSTRQVRRVAAELATRCGLVGSSGRGLYWVATEADKQEAMAHLNSRAMHLLRRRRALRLAQPGRVQSQLLEVAQR